MKPETPETIDQKLDNIGNNLNKLVLSVDVILVNKEKLDNLLVDTKTLNTKVDSHGERIFELESFKKRMAKRVNILQVMSILIFLTASAGVALQLTQ